MSFSIAEKEVFADLKSSSIETSVISGFNEGGQVLVLGSTDPITQGNTGLAVGQGAINSESSTFTCSSRYLRLGLGSTDPGPNSCGIVSVVGDSAVPTNATVTGSTAEVAGVADASFAIENAVGAFQIGDMVETIGHPNTVNNGLYQVVAVAAASVSVATANGPTNATVGLREWLNNRVQGSSGLNAFIRKVELDVWVAPTAAGPPGRRRGSTSAELVANIPGNGTFDITQNNPPLLLRAAVTKPAPVLFEEPMPDFSLIKDPEERKNARRAHRRARIQHLQEQAKQQLNQASQQSKGKEEEEKEEEEEEPSAVPEWTKTATVGCSSEPFTVIHAEELERKVEDLKNELRNKEKVIGDILARLATLERKVDSK